jgi:hypothetical protein
VIAKRVVARQDTEKQIRRIQEERSESCAMYGLIKDWIEPIEENTQEGDAESPYVFSVKPAIDNISIVLTRKGV